MVLVLLPPSVRTVLWTSFYNHDDKEAENEENPEYTTFDDAGRFTGFTVREEGNNVVVTANYKLGCFDQAVWTIAPDGTAAIDFTYNFSGVVDLMGDDV